MAEPTSMDATRPRERFAVTYQVVTPESAALGDVADQGYELEDCSLREAIGIVGRGSCEDGGRWFTTVDARVNYRNGSETTFSVHPPKGITPASYARVARLLTGRR